MKSSTRVGVVATAPEALTEALGEAASPVNAARAAALASSARTPSFAPFIDQLPRESELAAALRRISANHVTPILHRPQVTLGHSLVAAEDRVGCRRPASSAAGTPNLSSRPGAGPRFPRRPAPPAPLPIGFTRLPGSPVPALLPLREKVSAPGLGQRPTRGQAPPTDEGFR